MSGEIRSGGLMLYYVLVMVLTPVGALFYGVGQDVDSPRWWVTLGLALIAVAVGVVLHCFRRDAWNTTRLVLVFSVLFALLGVAFASTLLYGVVGVVVAGLCGAYLAWRTYGAEQAPDLLVGDDVMEIDGIAIRLPRKVHACPGSTVWVQFDLQNAWTGPVEFHVRLRSWGKRVSEMPTRVVQRLGPLEAGSIRIPITTHAHAKGRLRISVAVRGRGRAWLGRRGRLRPKPPLPVGPMWVLFLMGLAAEEALQYRSASFELVFGDEAAAALEPEASVPWNSTWRPPQDP